MANRGRGRRGGGWNNNPLPSAFDQRAFIEAIGVATATITQASVVAATIAQASATVGQGGPSNPKGSRQIILQPSREEGT